MITGFGLALLLLWFLNTVWVLIEVLKHTSDWKDIDAEKVIMNFMANTPPKRMELISQVTTVNPMIGLSGLVIIIFGTII